MSFCQDKLQESAYKILTEYQAATVTLLSLISASTGDVSKKSVLDNIHNIYGIIEVCVFVHNWSEPFICRFGFVFRKFP